MDTLFGKILVRVVRRDNRERRSKGPDLGLADLPTPLHVGHWSRVDHNHVPWWIIIHLAPLPMTPER